MNINKFPKNKIYQKNRNKINKKEQKQKTKKNKIKITTHLYDYDSVLSSHGLVCLLHQLLN
jgi:hypothetical protein